MQNENRIASERARLNMTQEALARKLGVSKPTIKKYERGGAIPSTALIKMVMEFGVSSDYLLGLDNTVERKPNLQRE